MGGGTAGSAILSTTLVVLRGIGILVVVLIAVSVAVLFIAVNYSGTDSTFRCDGTLTEEGQKRATTLFMTLTEYRWWVSLWSSSQGRVLIEAPKEGLPPVLPTA